MKVKNIVFSGFAAAILMGTAGANAATPFRIASQAYVDKQVSALTGENGAVSQLENLVAGENDELDEGFESETVVGAVNELKEDVDTLTGGANTPGSVAEAKAAADAAQGDVDALEGVVGNTELTTTAQTVTAAINELNTALDTKANATDLTALTTRVTTAESDIDVLEAKVGTDTMGTNAETVTGAIKELGESISSLTGGAGSVANQINDKLGTDFGGENGYATVTAALADKADASDVTALETTMGSATLTTTAQTVTGAINELDGDITAINTALNGKQNALSADDLAAIATLVNGYTSCVNDTNNESEHCVLSVAKGGTPTWVPVTDPWQVEP